MKLILGALSIAPCASVGPLRISKASKSMSIDSINAKAFKGKSEDQPMSLESKAAKLSKGGKSGEKKHNLCWTGCESYSWPAYPVLGCNKWLAMVEEMGENCE